MKVGHFHQVDTLSCYTYKPCLGRYTIPNARKLVEWIHFTAFTLLLHCIAVRYGIHFQKKPYAVTWGMTSASYLPGEFRQFSTATVRASYIIQIKYKVNKCILNPLHQLPLQAVTFL